MLCTSLMFTSARARATPHGPGHRKATRPSAEPPRAPKRDFCLRQSRARPTPDRCRHLRHRVVARSGRWLLARNKPCSPTAANRRVNAVSAGAVPRRVICAGRFAQLIFFRCLGEVIALSGLGQKPRDELIRHLLKGVMDCFFPDRRSQRGSAPRYAATLADAVANASGSPPAPDRYP